MHARKYDSSHPLLSLVYSSFPMHSPHNFTSLFYWNPLSPITIVRMRTGIGPSTGARKTESQKNSSPSSSSYHLATVPSLGAGPGEHLHKGWSYSIICSERISCSKAHMLYAHICTGMQRLPVCVRPCRAKRLVLLCRSIVLQLIFFP